MDADLTGSWAGWRLRGRYLISPDGDRISVERLRGIAITEFLRKTFGPKARPQGAELLQLEFRDRVDRNRSSTR